MLATMNHVSVGALASAVCGIEWDHIVGIPRGGLIVATLIGYRLENPRVSALTFAYTRDDKGGAHPFAVLCSPDIREGQDVLLVEDATDSGTLMEGGRSLLRDHGADVMTAALWVRKSSPYRPDVWLGVAEELPSARDMFAGIDLA